MINIYTFVWRGWCEMEKYQFDSATKAALEKLRVPLAVYQFIDKRVVTILLSDGFCELFGFDNKDDAYYVMDHDMYRATHPEDRARAADAAYRFAIEGGNYEVVYRTLTHKRTDYMIVHAIGEHIRTEDGVTLAYIWYAYEGTYTTENEDNKTSLSAAMERTVREENMIKGNYFDYLTGLPNMSYFFELAHEWRKLDLFVTEQVLEKMKKQGEAGLYVVSESVNLSRADFTSCDIVEEIRRRVDAAGLSRDKINIEVTESVIGSDFEFMKSQIERFRSLGFRVWMDDFGSGYSTLDVLQSIRFDLIKFDMRFMKEFDTSEKSRIMLTELIRMAISLGVDTVCEGVETKEQADFLREIGCTMMQGYYFCRPIPFEKILERYQKVIQIGFENPEESGYYAAVGKINLYDLAILSNEDQE